MLQYWTAYIWLCTAFSPTQTAHDPSLAAFVAVTGLAEGIIVMQPERRWNYIAESAIIHPLFYVAQKCRDGNIRRRVVEVLKGAGGEGVWDGMCTAAACEWIIEKEEEGLEEGLVGSTDPRSSAFIEERFRLRNAKTSVNRSGKTLRIAGMRSRGDGIDETVEGLVKWGELRSIGSKRLPDQ
jgi:hypothetical protein